MNRLGGTSIIPLLILSVAWGQELIDQIVFGGRWNLPMLPGGSFLGVLTAPFSHGDLGHLLGNSLWFLPLSWLVLLKSWHDYLAVWVGVYVMAIPVWLFSSNGNHGLSGVVFALVGYLIVIGFLERRPLPLLLSLFSLVSYGGFLPGLLPFFTPAGVSWIGHLSGFAGGVLAALAVYREPSSFAGR
ncbi:rhomboid family intramembrane serine protease [Synechococcus sp. Cruz-9H2]|nr:rhomboid family intramembrane serine protease [Synechococcus sp. Cruz-9H2]MCP9843713.1 rhomboid family intramembrane serine protease [Synechococcus sp. Edmonson 11F2]MCP9855568.1 rhomboid family intramembrane serine protease [Synechococcus sp. Cruz-9C9]MCP9863006.1 rhomboid family intramembrane serine protease [Synechococcus sp. Cruz-7E5]MCP9870119.1 rhomboid family intramembrane serine protease [Synechococcus sp. Cruz-7B9]